MLGKLLVQFADFPTSVDAMSSTILFLMASIESLRYDYLVGLTPHNLHRPILKANDSRKKNKFDKAECN